MNTRIKKIRKYFGMTQTEFGERIGVKGNTITNYESGNRVPTDAILKSICREFNVNEGWLRTGSGDMFMKKPEDELDALADRYDLSRSARILIRKFVELPAKEREAVLHYVDSVAAAIAAQPEGIAKTIPEMTEDEIHHRAKEIEQEMLMEKRAAASSSPSKRTAG